MRIAVVSDIHANGTAFDAVLKDLRRTSPDLILHGGDLADGGSSPAEIVDRIRDLGWPGVAGNTDDMLSMPETLESFAAQSPHLQKLWDAIRDMAAHTREKLGEQRLAWLRDLPRIQVRDPIALVHASPENVWRAPMPQASDAELESVYGITDRPIAIYGHIHLPYVRNLPRRIVANSGSVGIPHDGDLRAAYLLIDDSTPSIQRVEYDVQLESRALAACGLPHADWVVTMLATGYPAMP